MSDCLFCKIASGDIPCTKVYEDEKVLAFEDIHPAAPVHVVIIPKKHLATLMDIDAANTAIAGDLISAVQKVAKIKGIAQKGFRTVINCNDWGGQIIFHLHVHVLGGKKLHDEMG
jgi:histidine triad (HIT) family protein